MQVGGYSSVNYIVCYRIEVSVLGGKFLWLLNVWARISTERNLSMKYVTLLRAEVWFLPSKVSL